MERLLNFARENWLAFTIFALLAILALSLWPVEKLPNAPGTDKLHHSIAYTLLVLPTALRKPSGWIFFGLFFIAYSGAIELIQPYVNRYGEWSDMFANTLGIFLGFLIAEIMNFFFPASLNRYGKLMRKA
jgi:VanZ family protein